MNIHIRSLLSVTVGLLAATFAFAQAPQIGAPVEFLIAAGSSSGTYEQLTKELASVTNDTVTFKIVPSHGAVENLDHLINNEAMVAMLHSDVIYQRYSTMTNLPQRYQTLVALHSEEVHLLALTNPKRSTGGKLGTSWGSQPVLITTLEDLKPGTTVGAAGGGFVSANVIKGLLGMQYEIAQFNSGGEVLNALNKGEIDVALFVGGAPLPNLKELGPEYHLVSVSDVTASRLKQVYHPATLTYTKMSPQGISTIAADCILVARVYKTARFVSALRAFRAEFYSKLPELSETAGTHPKWSSIDPTARGTWTWMDLGDAATLPSSPQSVTPTGIVSR